LQVPLSHWPVVQSLSLTHCTQTFVSRCKSQNGVGAAQSVFAAHATHLPSPQTFVAGVAAQSALVMHCTHVESAVLHFAVVPEHCASAVQPVRHLNSWGSQMGAATPQSALDVHCTHSCWVARHRGAAAGQSVLASH
jgi:hypothetical protein